MSSTLLTFVGEACGPSWCPSVEAAKLIEASGLRTSWATMASTASRALIARCSASKRRAFSIASAARRASSVAKSRSRSPKRPGVVEARARAPNTPVLETIGTTMAERGAISRINWRCSGALSDGFPLLRGDVAQQLGALGLGRPRSELASRLEGERREPLTGGDLGRIRGRHRQAHRLAPLEDVDDAEIRDAGDDELRDRSEGLLVVQRGGQHRSGLGKDLTFHLDALAVRDVPEHDREQPPAADVELRDRRLGRELLAALSNADDRRVALAHLPRRRLPRREPSDVAPVLGPPTGRKEQVEGAPKISPLRSRRCVRRHR